MNAIYIKNNGAHSLLNRKEDCYDYVFLKSIKAIEYRQTKLATNILSKLNKTENIARLSFPPALGPSVHTIDHSISILTTRRHNLPLQFST